MILNIHIIFSKNTKHCLLVTYSVFIHISNDNTWLILVTKFWFVIFNFDENFIYVGLFIANRRQSIYKISDR